MVIIQRVFVGRAADVFVRSHRTSNWDCSGADDSPASGRARRWHALVSGTRVHLRKSANNSPVRTQMYRWWRPSCFTGAPNHRPLLGGKSPLPYPIPRRNTHEHNNSSHSIVRGLPSAFSMTPSAYIYDIPGIYIKVGSASVGNDDVKRASPWGS